MKIELIKTWSGYPPGHVFSTMHTGMQKTLVQRGFAKVLEKDVPQPSPKVTKPNPSPEQPTENTDGDNGMAPESEPEKPAAKRRGRKKA